MIKRKDKYGVSDAELINYSEWLQNAHKQNLYNDHIRFFIRKYSLLFRLFKLTKSIILAKYIAKKEASVYKRKLKLWVNAPYQQVLTELLESIEIEVGNIARFPDKLENVQILDIRGFDIFNAEAFPCFGENLIAIQSGVCFHSHTLARALENVLQTDSSEFPRGSFIYKMRYARISTGIICRDHTRSLSLWSLIPIDDSLYTGIELFVVAHEYAHCMYRLHSIDDFNFEAYFSEEIVMQIKQDEEIAADAFAVVILDSYVKNNPQCQMAYYGPRFFFKNFAQYESELLVPTPKSHPTYEQRYTYLKTMLSSLRDTSKHDAMDAKMDIIWEETKSFVKSASYRIHRNDAHIRTIRKDMYKLLNSRTPK